MTEFERKLILCLFIIIVLLAVILIQFVFIKMDVNEHIYYNDKGLHKIYKEVKEQGEQTHEQINANFSDYGCSTNHYDCPKRYDCVWFMYS